MKLVGSDRRREEEKLRLMLRFLYLTAASCLQS